MDFGMRNRFSRIINPRTGKCVMLAVDHGYFLGAISGLENLTEAVEPLLPYADALMITRGGLRNWIDPDMDKPIILRMSGGNSIERKDNLDEEILTVSMKDAIRINASAITCNINVGASNQQQTVKNLAELVDKGQEYGFPVLAVTAVGAKMSRDAKYFTLASRMAIETGAHMVKTYYCDGFEKVVEACGNTPVVIAGGKRIDKDSEGNLLPRDRPERTALEMAYKAMDAGASGVDMGRNIFNSDYPLAMIQAVDSIVHKNASVEDAFEEYKQIQAVLKE